MKCEWVKDNILLYVYNELADDARYELEQHLARCTDCAAKLNTDRQLHTTLSSFRVEEPSPNLLTASRMRLQEALETAEQGGFWKRLIFDPAAWLRPIRFAPALAAAIFIVGFAGGIGATYQMMHNRVIVEPAAQASEASIAGIRSVSQEPGSDQISIKYDTISTQEAQGSLNDQRIQQLLLFERGVDRFADAVQCRQLGDAALALLEQLRILQRDRRLVGHAGQQ
jgi:anti-sigma factor RsiW